MGDMTALEGLPRDHYGAILADPPWRFETWSHKGRDRSPDYALLGCSDISALPVSEIASDDCVLFLWAIWPMLETALETVTDWGFTYKTAAFVWAKPQMGLGYWTRSGSEVCLLATRGKPRRLNADVRQVIIEPRREHSRKPDCVHERIERLVAGPYLELFARQRRPGWDSWGNEVDKFKPPNAVLPLTG